MKTIVPLCALVLSYFPVSYASADAAGPPVRSLALTADRAITGLYINGEVQPEGSHAADWTRADTYGPIPELRVIALRVEGNPGQNSGLIGRIELEDGSRLVTDELWKVYHDPNGKPPPRDAYGREWFEEAYDDSDWASAVPMGGNGHGNYGVAPWGSDFAGMDSRGDEAGERQAYLDEHMAVFDEEGNPLHRANWVWMGNATYAVTPIYVRRTFVPTDANLDQPPTRPVHFRVSEVESDRVTLDWDPSHSTHGPVTYEVYWNGFPLLETAEPGVTITEEQFPGGLRITTFPQNFFYVKARDTAGNRSGPTLFRVATLEGVTGYPLDEAPPVVQNPRVIKTGKDYLVLKWDRPSGRYGNEHYYQIRQVGAQRGIGGTGGGRNIAAVTKLSPDTTYDLEMRLRTTYRRKASEFSEPVRARTLPAEGEAVVPPTPVNLAYQADPPTLRWDMPGNDAGITAYRVYRDGQRWQENVPDTSLPLPEADSSGLHSYQVTAVDEAGRESLRSVPWVGPGRDTTPPSTPRLIDAGRTDRSAIIRWHRAEDDAGLVRYRLIRKRDGAMEHSQWLNENFQDAGVENEARFHGLEPGTRYTFELLAKDASGNTSEMDKLQIQTVAPPDPRRKPVAVFGYALHPKVQHANLKKVLEDMADRGCQFAIIGGSIGHYNVVNDDNWQSIRSITEPLTDRLPIVFNPGGHDKNPSVDPPKGANRELYGTQTYNGFIHHSGPLHRQWREGPVLFAKTMFAGDVNKQTEPRSESFILETLMEAERDPDIRWLFFKGAAIEYHHSVFLSRIMFQTFRPTICFDRPSNGNPGYEVFWLPGDNFLVTCPQRLRADNSYGYFMVYVYEDRILVESYNIDHATDRLVLTVRYEIEYDRENNQLRPSIARRTGAGKPYEGHVSPQDLVDEYPWAQNRFVTTEPNRPVEVELLGRSAAGKPLSYEITAHPEYGQLTGEPPRLRYQPEPGFVGQDRVFYRVNDGKDSNMAWVRIDIGTPTE